VREIKRFDALALRFREIILNLLKGGDGFGCLEIFRENELEIELPCARGRREAALTIAEGKTDLDGFRDIDVDCLGEIALFFVGGELGFGNAAGNCASKETNG
jgi:hypothetical protein